MVEWNGGVDYWSGVLNWSATPTNAQFGPAINLIFERQKAGKGLMS